MSPTDQNTRARHSVEAPLSDVMAIHDRRIVREVNSVSVHHRWRLGPVQGLRDACVDRHKPSRRSLWRSLKD